MTDEIHEELVRYFEQHGLPPHPVQFHLEEVELPKNTQIVVQAQRIVIDEKSTSDLFQRVW